MMRNFFFILFLVFFSCSQTKDSILIEAENFKDKGGWLVDAQFVPQMGSPYLLAHGMGSPVKNAVTDTLFSAAGKYYVWARTMNWVPGNWPAPGRFRIRINGHELPADLGTETGWGWQSAGRIKIAKGKSIIELADQTGFEGRCDAIYFSTENIPPPNQPEVLAGWRIKMHKENGDRMNSQEFDLVIVGGGIAGCAAAIAAAEQGLKVALIQDRPVLGGNASGEIRVFPLGITGHYGRILKMISSFKEYPNGSPEALIEGERRMKNMLKYDNLSLFLNWQAYEVNTKNDSINSVDARNTTSGERKRFTAPFFTDCTGDGWIGFWAGAEYKYGREDSSVYHEGWSKYGDLWSPKTGDGRVMGSSILWRTVDAGQPVNFPEVPWAMEVAKNHSDINGEWYWELISNDLNQIDDAEKIRDHLFRAIYGSFFNAKQKPQYSNLKLEWVSYLIAKRESRRIMGDYIYTFSDMKNMKEFRDAVVREEREIDVHYSQDILDPGKPDFYAEALYYKVDHYYIPYRCLYSKNIKNLFMAGRCFSCSHIGLGGPRVMNTTGQMGAATGYAASLCKKYSTCPRTIYQKHLKELLDLISASNDFKPQYRVK